MKKPRRAGGRVRGLFHNPLHRNYSVKVHNTRPNHNHLGPLSAWADTQRTYCTSWQHNRLAREWGLPVSVAKVIASANGLGPKEVL